MTPVRPHLRTVLLASLLLSLTVPQAYAKVRLPGLFDNHMVLQRDAPIHLWGWADPDEQVSVQLGNARVAASADNLGHWSLYLPPQPAGGPVEITIAGTNTLTLTDVLIGDVWVASGQSNMQMPLGGFGSSAVLKDGEKEIAAATHPEIRLFQVPNRASAYRTNDIAATWTLCTPTTAKDFSAVAYFFGREIAAKEKVPVGLIDATWGGTPAEAWVSTEALASEPALAPVLLNWSNFANQQANLADTVAAEKREDAEALAAGTPIAKHPWHPNPDSWSPSQLFNGMIAPLTPFSIRGVIWYQGETNSALDRAPLYHRLFSTLIADWRSQWGQGDFPFFFAQISSFRSTPQEAWGVLRDAQRRTLSVANTGMAVTIDVGDPDNVHPADKQTVGHRLALLARAQVYGEKIEDSGPVFEQATAEGTTIRAWFQHVGKGLAASDGGVAQGFEVAGADHRFAAAQARIEGSSVAASSPEVKNPIYIRYAWPNAPQANLVNSFGLPTSTFTSEQHLAGLTLLPTAH